MSVAFRRESDEEHLEPKFAIPIPPGPNLVTARGKALIDAQVLACGTALAGASEEAAITAAKRELSYWQTRQITAQMPPTPSGEHVEFGTTITFLHLGKSRTLTIVGVDEADAALDLIGFTAPLARAMMGSEVGDMLSFGGHDDAIEIISISPAGPLPVRSSP